MNDDAIDLVLSALAHPARRRMVDLLSEQGGLSVGQVAERFDMSRIGVMKHLAVLERADLVISRKEGRSRLLYFNAVPIQRIHDRWTSQYGSFWTGRLEDLKTRIESKADAPPGPLRTPEQSKLESAKPKKPGRKVV